jgi:hypothetical protein
MIKWFVDWAKAIYGGTKMWIKGEKFESDEETAKPQPGLKEKENTYLTLGFFEFSILATLVISLFPFSILFLYIFVGPVGTVLILGALWDDLIKTLLAVLAIVIPLAILIIYLVVSNT